ncbi:GNAT family N-acetyltransferase [Polynucleobacter sp. AP-Jannik-300A-C4]|uniref:GNAT family N-acetyltransferase n=1 Tax=Polynucleobacter sp. AP-Jannik-300A-C4 TaxID=2576928 RepID=UPI001BFE56FC|nr:GNAT family N-acetyltransferase [Polynucleobacter sp. AP-Jannik-300A-C4]QWE22601.1 GNAT family N-acetyltransferase [Polynucleobacter sp. AP-Jannik-300A-C4]
MNFDIRRDNLSGADVQALVQEHITEMLSNSPIESVHALPLDSLRKPEITFWSVWRQGEISGCGALMELDGTHGEIKSMRTKAKFLRMGVGQAMLNRIISEANMRGYTRLSLETGSAEAFKPALTLYKQNGFEVCGPFGDYKHDPHSVFMTKIL